ncbi:MAG: hypothetical protein FJ086_08845 [Deltaproteobacteria bacterium]|nr:hypothetical protein [Deltaproteobacteria bacterium]
MARNRIPREVLERARSQATRVADAPTRPGKDVQEVPAAERPAQARAAGGKREKIVRALRKLHPMD